MQPRDKDAEKIFKKQHHLRDEVVFSIAPKDIGDIFDPYTITRKD